MGIHMHHMHCYGKDLICPPTPAHHPTPAHTRPHLAQPYVDFSFLLGRAGSLFLLPCGSPARRGKSCCAPRPLLSQSSTLRFWHACWLVRRLTYTGGCGMVGGCIWVWAGVGKNANHKVEQDETRKTSLKPRISPRISGRLTNAQNPEFREDLQTQMLDAVLRSAGTLITDNRRRNDFCFPCLRRALRRFFVDFHNIFVQHTRYWRPG